MLKMKKVLLGLIMFAALVSFQSPAQAVVLEFETAPLFNKNGFGLNFGLQNPNNPFQFQNVVMTVDTTFGGTGKLTLNGTVKHYGSNEIWNMNVTMDSLHFASGPIPMPGVVPYDGMFQDLLSTPFATLTHDSLDFVITPTVANPAYTGPTSGKAAFRNTTIHASEIGYKTFGNVTGLPSDYYGISAFVEDNAGNHFGDFHFAFFNPKIYNPSTPGSIPHNPEPVTAVSFLIGLGGLAFRRFRKK